MHPSRPNALFMQLHWDVMRTDNAGDNWHEVSGNLPTDFGFPIDVHAHEPDTVYVVPITSDSLHYPPEGKLRVYRSKTGGNEWEALTKGLPQENCYVNVLRDAMSVDTLDKCGIYFGTTGGQVYCSPDGGDNWSPICPRSAGGAVGRGADAAMIRVVLPYHLRTLARIDGEVQLDVAAPVTQRIGPRRAGSPLSDAARHDSRSRHAEAPAAAAVLRLRGGPVPRIARRTAARRGRLGRGTVLDRRRHRGRLMSGIAAAGW